MKPMIATTTIALLMAGQAQALSCMAPDIARSFGWASAAEERYIVLSGEISYDAPEKLQTNEFEPESASYAARFDGSYLGADGFVVAPPLDVTLNFVCLGPWCGSIGDGEDDILVFAEQTSQGYTIEIDPCFSTVFPSTDENIQRVEACMRGEACEEIPF